MKWSDKTVEAVARRICEQRTWAGAWLKANDAEKNAWRYDAEAALAAVAECSEVRGLVEALYKVEHDLAVPSYLRQLAGEALAPFTEDSND